MTKKSTLWLPCSIILTTLISCGGGRAGTAPTQINLETNASRAQASPTQAGAHDVPPPVSGNNDIPFYSMEGDFRVTLPQGFPLPSHVKQSQSAETGVKTDAYNSRSSRGTCLIAYFEYPESYFAGKDARKLLEFRTESLVNKTNATLLKKEALSVQGKPAISFLLTVADQSSGKKTYMRRYEIIARPRIYQIAFLTEDEDEINRPDTEAFLKSFQLTK